MLLNWTNSQDFRKMKKLAFLLHQEMMATTSTILMDFLLHQDKMHFLLHQDKMHFLLLQDNTDFLLLQAFLLHQTNICHNHIQILGDLHPQAMLDSDFLQEEVLSLKHLQR